MGVDGGAVGGGRGQAAESRGDIVFGHKTLNSNLSNFIPADRCLAGQNIHTRGGVGEDGGGAVQVEGVGARTIFGRGIKAGHAIPPPPSLSPLH